MTPDELDKTRRDRADKARQRAQKKYGSVAGHFTHADGTNPINTTLQTATTDDTSLNNIHDESAAAEDVSMADGVPPSDDGVGEERIAPRRITKISSLHFEIGTLE